MKHHVTLNQKTHPNANHRTPHEESWALPMRLQKSRSSPSAAAAARRTPFQTRGVDSRRSNATSSLTGRRSADRQLPGYQHDSKQIQMLRTTLCQSLNKAYYPLNTNLVQRPTLMHIIYIVFICLLSSKNIGKQPK